ncbi:hypothetical protein M419DRAFT_89409 [Trichoderma reesei RUT C-30]|uniref:BZIP domain-containing protein n=1 Tax=Hypocrea jecorina (strain ATCC 56765 / BCRC 32924 / NRRL 11460 / Rut C-30) TaxID=1344414 RepID=A0A024S1S4_HYPJR|nr:hypothetical protein M419DRAFT_89409 [Trichoderma reesei RUT C-30]
MTSTMASDKPRRSGRQTGSKPQNKLAENEASLEKRRQRNRKAQRLFRLRRQAAHESYEKKLVHMEGALEHMAATFLDFTNGILQSPLITRDPGLISKLRTATDSILFLCQGSSGDSGDSPDNGEDDTEIAAHDINGTGYKHGLHGNGAYTIDSALNNTLLDFDASKHAPTAPASGSNNSTAQPKPIASQPPQIRNIFGNGFMNLPPIDFGDCLHSAAMPKVYPADDSLSIIVTRASLQNAYDALLNDVEANSSMVDRIFGFPLKFRTREEILMVLRWYLRPQTPELVRLATAEFDDYLVAQYYHGIVNSQYRAVEGVFHGDKLKALDRETLPPAQSRILNAYQIEQWLLSCGMKYVGVDTIELTDLRPTGLLLHTKPPDDPDILLTTFATLQQEKPLHHGYVFDGQTASGYTPTGSEVFSNSIRLSRTRLIHVLTGISFCIDKGPAYCEQALFEAVVTAMVSDG